MQNTADLRKGPVSEEGRGEPRATGGPSGSHRARVGDGRNRWKGRSRGDVHSQVL